MDGRGREVVNTAIRNCVQAITLDFITQSVYWVNTCLHRLESVRIDGADTSEVFKVQLSPLHSIGISIFENYLYWTATSRFNYIARLNRTSGATVTQVTNRVSARGIEVVHPSRQPEISKLTINC